MPGAHRWQVAYVWRIRTYALHLGLGHLHGSGVNDTESSKLKTTVPCHAKIYPGFLLV